MDVASVLLVVAALGVSDGWQPVTAENLPRNHTVHFQNGDRYQSTAPSSTNYNRQYDQRGATIGVEPIRTAQSSPWTLDGMKQAVESGIQQANQSQTSWPAPPPPATAGLGLASSPATNQTTTRETWTTIRPEFAPPRLPTPTMSNANRLASNPSLSRGGGPAFPAASESRAPMHSLLTDANTSAGQRSTAPDWSNAWGSASKPGQAPAPATIGQSSRGSHSDSNDDSVGLVPVPPRVRTSLQAPTAADPDAARWAWPEPARTSAPSTFSSNSGSPTVSNPAADGRYHQPVPAAPAPATNTGADVWANFGTPAGSVSNNASPTDRYAAQPPDSVTPGPLNQPGNQPAVDNQAVIGVAQPAPLPGQMAPAGEEVRWKPLLAVSLALAGSLGANLFLGWSYGDARHRYHALVAKTTHSFQKAAGLAA